VDINAGHCVHDEAPQPVNQAIDVFLQGIEDKRLKRSRGEDVGSNKETDSREVAVDVREKITALQELIRRSETATEAQTNLLLTLLNVVDKANEVVLQVAKYSYILSKQSLTSESAVDNTSQDWLQLAWDGLAVAELGEKSFRLAWASCVDRSKLVDHIQDYVSKLQECVDKLQLSVGKAGGLLSASGRSFAVDNSVKFGDTGIEVENEENSYTVHVDTSLDEMKRLLQTGEEVAQSLNEEGREGDFTEETNLYVEMLKCARVAEGVVSYAHQFLKELK